MEAKKTPIEQSLIDRVVQGAKYVISGVTPEGWFSPQQPLAPLAQDKAEGRQFDYPVGWNTRIISTKEGVTFGELRGLADGYDLLRLVIETRKDQVAGLSWGVKYKDDKKENDATIEAIEAFFAYPDKEHDHETWVRALLEDLFVIDAPAIYPRMKKGGGLYALELMDGATINRLIDDGGRTPMPPSPAYQQILKGVPAVDYTREQLIYKPRNIRTFKVYGFSPVEQIIMTVNIALRRQIGQFNYYSEGNIPEALASVPEAWSVEQLREFQKYWDAIIEGDMAQKRKLKFIPHGVSYIPTKEPVLKDMFDEWLAKLICFAFSISSQALSNMMNRATAETAKNSADSEGLVPIKNWVKSLHDYIIVNYFGRTDIEFAWKDDAEPDAKTKAEISQIYVNAGIKTRNEVRAELGLEALSDEELMPQMKAMQDKEEDDEEDDKKAPKDKPKNKEGGKSTLGKWQRAEVGKIVNFSIKKSDETEGTPINRNREEITEAIEKSKNIIAKQLYSFGKTIAGNIGKEWDKKILHRWKKGEYDRVYINGLNEGKAYFEEVGGQLHLKAYASGSADVLDEQIKRQLQKAFGDYWQEVFYPQMGANNSITYADIIRKSHGFNDYLNHVDDVDFKLLVKKVEPIIESTYKEGVKAGFESIAYNPDREALTVLNERAVQWASTRGLELAKLTESTKRYLRPIIEEAITESHNVGTLKKELEESYGFSAYRAEMIARTEMAFADSQGNYDAWEASGIVKYKRSVLGTNENHGMDDIENAKQGIIPFKKAFGSGHQCPPYHPNCMCALQPIIEKDDE